MAAAGVGVPAGTSLYVVAERLRRERGTCAPVVDAAGTLLGLVSETDVVREAVRAACVPDVTLRATKASILVESFMTPAAKLTVLTPGEAADPLRLAAVLGARGVKHLPIVESRESMRVVEVYGSIKAAEKLLRSVKASDKSVSDRASCARASGAAEGCRWPRGETGVSNDSTRTPTLCHRCVLQEEKLAKLNAGLAAQSHFDILRSGELAGMVLVLQADSLGAVARAMIANHASVAVVCKDEEHRRDNYMAGIITISDMCVIR
jgi:CBS domain-containing protein